MPESEWLIQLEKLPYPTQRCDGKTMIVVGANIGMGLEAARHFVRLGATKTIVGVRTMSKGLEAQKSIEASESRPGSTEVWEVDLGSYKSTLAFARRVHGLERVDAVVMNASVAMREFVLVEDNETQITVNVISTFLLIMGILPKLRESAKRWNTVPVIAVVSSGVHAWVDLPERNTPSILAALADEKSAKMSDRYSISKLMQVFAVRELVDQMTKEPKLTINVINPGLAKTALTRHATGGIKWAIGLLKFLMARTAEEASRTLVHAALAGPETNGQYISNCDPSRNTLSDFVKSDEGLKAQKKLWTELTEKFEGIQLGIMVNL